MARLCGRAFKGQRCLAPVPFGHRQNTFTAGFRLAGLAAPFLLDGPMDGVAFLTYARRVLVSGPKPGDIVIMDNLPAYKVTGGAKPSRVPAPPLFYLPPCSPDLDPIKKAFPKVKAILRKAAACTLEGLWAAIASTLDAFTSEECRNYFAACGYGPVQDENALDCNGCNVFRFVGPKACGALRTA
jgi:transposase